METDSGSPLAHSRSLQLCFVSVCLPARAFCSACASVHESVFVSACVPVFCAGTVIHPQTCPCPYITTHAHTCADTHAPPACTHTRKHLQKLLPHACVACACLFAPALIHMRTPPTCPHCTCVCARCLLYSFLPRAFMHSFMHMCRYQPDSGTSACVQCLPGLFQSSTGATSCLPCGASGLVGEFQAELGQTACDPCPKGTFQDAPQATACVACRSDGSKYVKQQQRRRRRRR